MVFFGLESLRLEIIPLGYKPGIQAHSLRFHPPSALRLLQSQDHQARAEERSGRYVPPTVHRPHAVQDNYECYPTQYCHHT